MIDMAESLNILNDFPPVPTKAWEAAIHVDLKGEDYHKKLVWNSDEGIVVRPYRVADPAGDRAARELLGLYHDLNPKPLMGSDSPPARDQKGAEEF